MYYALDISEVNQYGHDYNENAGLYPEGVAIVYVYDPRGKDSSYV